MCAYQLKILLTSRMKWQIIHIFFTHFGRIVCDHLLIKCVVAAMHFGTLDSNMAELVPVFFVDKLRYWKMAGTFSHSSGYV